MKKILYIGNKLQQSGNNSTSIETLGKFLANEGYQMHYASSKKNKVLRLLDMLLSCAKLRKQVNSVLIDVYSTQNFYYALAVSVLCNWLSMPYIAILRGGNLEERLKNSPKLCSMIFKNAAFNVAPSAFMLNVFKNYGYNNLLLIPNSIQVSNYPFKMRSNVTAKLLWVRALAKIYNPEMAVKVASALQKKGYQTELCMVGPDKDGSFNKLTDLAKNLNIQVSFTGRLSKRDWIELADNYDIFINTTTIDNTPVSVLEAMALGLPVVTTNVGGIPFLLKDGHDARLVKSGDVEGMAHAVSALIENPDEVQKLTRNARKLAETFDWGTVKKQWFKLIEAC